MALKVELRCEGPDDNALLVNDKSLHHQVTILSPLGKRHTALDSSFQAAHIAAAVKVSVCIECHLSAWDQA